MARKSYWRLRAENEAYKHWWNLRWKEMCAEDPELEFSCYDGEVYYERRKTEYLIHNWIWVYLAVAALHKVVWALYAWHY